jgi:molecular chaperone GrpE
MEGSEVVKKSHLNGPGGNSDDREEAPLSVEEVVDEEKILEEAIGEIAEEISEELAKEEIAEAADEEAILRQQLEEEKAKSAEYLDGWQRARAELANARKRWERESAQTYTNAVTDVIAGLLPVVDDFERAVETVPENPGERTWVDGVLLIHRNLQTFLEQQGVTPIEAEPGTPFDPTFHQAVTHEPHETWEAGAIIAEFQKGYKLGERIVRPALVRVSSGPPPIDSEESEADE